MAEPQRKPGIVRRFLGKCWGVLSWIRVSLANLMFLVLIGVLIVVFVGTPRLIVAPGSVLVLNPGGVLVDQLSYTDPLSSLLAQSQQMPAETLLSDVVDAVDRAAEDERIAMLLIQLDYLQHGGLSKSQEIARALDRFRAAGKRIVAYGDNFTQDQYWLAAQADEVLLNPMGAVLLQGYGVYQSYLKRLLDKLAVDVHVFRVGKYKSAVEPLVRDDMSDAARANALVWLNQLWDSYSGGVTRTRKLEAGAVDAYINNMDTVFAATEGNTAAAALAQGLVDAIVTRDELNDYLIERVGADDEGWFKGIGFEDYLHITDREQLDPLPHDVVGLVVASGMIVDGEQPAGTVGGDTLASLIRDARRDDQVKALVLRVDSEGGSAFASEIIRQELLQFKQSGKPLVVSMGSVAASGGYWISAPADEIWATPATITGSIGIFGVFPTLDRALDKLGISNDGVGTTRLAGDLRLDRPLDPISQRAIQSTIEHGYQRFLDVVATGRSMSREQVDALGGGRVWSGVAAREAGLVDKLGYLEDAVASAAERAGLEDYTLQLIEPALTPQEALLRALFQVVGPSPAAHAAPSGRGAVNRWLEAGWRQLRWLTQLNDPQGMYAWCSGCLRP
ncbi:MAG TPA: signal peptide peptidase SppA [Spongiibacteraceae bacterium]|jgi:protease-4|nr:signal peptide peptidase SppA [Spongiibacteraceae bacterium]HUH38781.1 signal peptide peptidase SppA [Spongiibacteraceae bacterium]